MKRGALIGCLIAVCLLASAAHATFHIMVIDQVFPGLPQAPDAQFVDLQLRFAGQSFVHKQVIRTFDAAGNALTPFAMFCPQIDACDLPTGSPACAQGGCPNPFGLTDNGNDSHILIATAKASDLFCVTADLIATGSLPLPDGRVCFGDVHPFEPFCESNGPVDCVAYGDFTGDNGLFGGPAMTPALGQALVGVPARQPQCALKTDFAAVCVGGANANAACTMPADCGDGTCTQCPNGSCRSLLNDAAGFEIGMPMPTNFHGDLGQLDGVAGDPDGSGEVSDDSVAGEIPIAFEETDRRCGLPALRRGADANFDGRISAADVTATLRILLAAHA